jgi:hypothetical protein
MEDIEKKIEYIEETLESLDRKFESILNEYESDMTLENITIKKALQSQITLELVFSDIFSKSKQLFSSVDDLLELTLAEVTSKTMKNSYSDIKLQEAKTHALASATYRRVKELHTLAKGLLSDTQVAYDTVTSRKFILNNLSNLVIASSEGTIL